ncbi:MAG TPA: TIGR00725 family protein [Methanoregulaceae archaeon]|nr:TIGR00725 family protein [Methanoregulaceae archaeon]
MQVAVCGASVCDDELLAAAETIGRTIAEHGGILLTGGRSGVMAAASRGAQKAGGVVVGVLPDLSDGNVHLTVRIRTGMGHARNVVLVQSADAVVAVGGEFGTLSELAVALKEGIPVVCYRSWDLPGVVHAPSPEAAALAGLKAARNAVRRSG